MAYLYLCTMQAARQRRMPAGTQLKVLRLDRHGRHKYASTDTHLQCITVTCSGCLHVQLPGRFAPTCPLLKPEGVALLAAKSRRRQLHHKGTAGQQKQDFCLKACLVTPLFCLMLNELI